MPRLFLIQGLSETLLPMAGVRVQWPFEMGHAESEVLDLSLSGLAILGSGLLAKMKLGQSFEVKLKVDGVREPIPLKVRVIRLQAKMMGLAFESISTEGRLTLDQVVKDRLVSENLRLLSTQELHPEFHTSKWMHGPFDTNFFTWHKEDGSLKAALVEYDHLIWIYQEGKVFLQKSGSSTDEAKGYLDMNLTHQESSGKVSMGASWLDRLLKLIETVPANTSLQSLTLILRSQRNQ